MNISSKKDKSGLNNALYSQRCLSISGSELILTAVPGMVVNISSMRLYCTTTTLSFIKTLLYPDWQKCFPANLQKQKYNSTWHLPHQRKLVSFSKCASAPSIPGNFVSVLRHSDSLHATHFLTFQMLPVWERVKQFTCHTNLTILWHKAHSLLPLQLNLL